MNSPVVLAEGHAEVALIRFNRGPVRNAINFDLATEFCRAFEVAQQARVIVITGADPAFCAGLDLRDLGAERLADLPRCADAVAASAVPVIAAVNGPAVTGGLEIALACDFIVASERASFADTHLRVGVYPGPVLVDLPRAVGEAFAREMSLSGCFVDADTALRVGLVNRVVAHDEMLDEAMAIAAEIAEHQPPMVVDMRSEWDDLTERSRPDAHQRHREFAVSRGYRESRSGDLERRRDAVTTRSRELRQE